MSNVIWGIVWVREESDHFNDPAWYESAEDAILEFNQRSDKYWASRLVTGNIINIATQHDGNHKLPPWERDYQGHYYDGQDG